MKSNLKQLFLWVLIAVVLSSILSPNLAPAASANDKGQPEESISFQITAATNDGLDLVLTAPSYQITQTEVNGQVFDKIFVPGALTSTVAGQPELPVASALVGVPPQAKISLEITNDNGKKINSLYQISLAPFPAHFIEQGSDADQWDYQLVNELPDNQAIQSTSAFAAARIAEDAWIRDQRVIRIEYSPFEYEPHTGVLNWHPLVKLNLKFEYQSGKTPNNLINTELTDTSQPFEALLKDALINYAQAKMWRDLPVSASAQITPPEVGSRYRIAINEDGVYKLTYEELVAVDPNIAGVDSRLLHMTSQGQDIAVEIFNSNGNVVNQNDQFSPGDYIIFYGQRFYGDHLANLYEAENFQYRTFIQQQTDGTYKLWKPEFNDIMLEKYTYENVYWLYVGANDGPRMGTVNGDPSGNSSDPVPYFRETVRAEESMYWKTTLFTSEDTWFWDLIQIDEPSTSVLKTFTANVKNPANTGPQAVIRAEFVSSKQNSGLSFDHHTKVYFNTVEYGNFYWSGISRYTFEHSLTPASIQNGNNSLGIEALSDAEVPLASYYFNWFEIEYNRLFEAETNVITFNSAFTGTQKFQVNGFTNTNALNVLDISDPQLPVRVLNPAATANQVTISLTHAQPLTVTMAAEPHTVPNGMLSYYTPPSWSEMTGGVDYVYITHADFIDTTQALADYRANSGLGIAVFNIEDIYNEFNFGIFNPIAIKNFLAYTFDHWLTPPTYALLVGDGHWNFHEDNPTEYGVPPQFLPPNLAWVDPWQGEVDSTNLLATVEGSDSFPDVIIARLPVNNSTEIDNYLNKLSNYEAPHAPEAWEQNHLFIADNADSAGNFPDIANDVIDQYISPTPFADAIRIFQDDFGCTSSSSTECAAVRNVITNTINITGSLIINYIGHASVARWSHERILTPEQYPKLTNSNQLPVILSMTCLDGYWSGPSVYPGSSMIEEIVRQNNTGAIGAFSPTGLGVSTGHDLLHKGFYDSLMNAGLWELGAAAQNAKLWLFEAGIHPDLLHTFTIFGDPALLIRSPFRFSASPAESNQFTDTPGEILTHHIIVQNTGSEPDRYLIEVTNSPNWTVTLPYTISNIIAPGAQVTIPIQVQTPNPGSGSDTANVSITSNGDKSLVFESHLVSQIILEVFENFLPINTK